MTKKTTKKKAKKVAKKTTKKKTSKKKSKSSKKKSTRKTAGKKKAKKVASSSAEFVTGLDEENDGDDETPQSVSTDRAAIERRTSDVPAETQVPAKVGAEGSDLSDGLDAFDIGFGGGILDDDGGTTAPQAKRKSTTIKPVRKSTAKSDRPTPADQPPTHEADDSFFFFDDEDPEDDFISVDDVEDETTDVEVDVEIEDETDDFEEESAGEVDESDGDYDEDEYDDGEEETEPEEAGGFLDGFDLDDDGGRSTKRDPSPPKNLTSKNQRRGRGRTARHAAEEDVVEAVAGRRRSKLEDLASGKAAQERQKKSRSDTEKDRSRQNKSAPNRRHREPEVIEDDRSEFEGKRERKPSKGRRADAERDDRSSRSRADKPSEQSAGDDECQMLINMIDGEECRIAVLKDNRLDELYIERASSSSNVGNIYKGRVTNIEPSIQAAFVDFGQPAHGFLHISDLHPQYFDADNSADTELVGKKTPRKHRPPIQSCLKRGQEVIVQVIKEGIGTKGPTLSSYISIPGRFVVMMPGMEQLGVSRKIEDEEQRRKMRDLLGQLSLPKDMGFIVRTAGIDRTKRDLQRDLNYLSRLWKRVAARIKKVPAPAALYKESDLVIRTIRDVYDASLKKVIVDSEAVGARVSEFLSIASPRATDVVEVYDGDEPLFHRYGIEKEITQLYSKNVPLPCGGSLVIEQTEAMVAVDVNSGKFRVHEDAEETSYHVNCEAVDELARQLRLRDLGGLVVVDLIDMGLEKNRRAIEKRMSDALRKHKERAKVLRISRFGLLEMTRQRQGPSITRSMYNTCPRCLGTGRLKAPESVAMDAMRRIHIAASQDGVSRIDMRTSNSVANDLLNRKRSAILELEKKQNLEIRIQGVDSFSIDTIEVAAIDSRGRDIPLAIATGEQPRRSADRNNRGRGGRSRRGGRRSR